jgi:paired amphipathic helix protein Sin3a
VYAQVTTLFNTAPDLLEDFKQFLPESAAHAKLVAQQKAAEDAAALAGVAQTPQQHLGRVDQKIPPLGNFAPPPSTGKHAADKKRPRGNAPVNVPETSATRSTLAQNGHPAKVCSLNQVRHSVSYPANL